MTTIGTHLDKVQDILQDDGIIWSRAELLDYFVDAYRQLLATTSAVRLFTILEVPPRFPWSITYPWEAEFCDDGAAWQWAFQGEGGYAASHLWELELLYGITPTAAGETTVTAPWERSFVNPVHQHFRFAVPRDSERVIKLWYDHELLLPIAVKTLDRLETNWYSLEGRPLAWTQGVGPNRTVEVFEIVTAYVDSYRTRDAVTNDTNPLHGIARQYSGARTYSWVSDTGGSVPYGISRHLSSPDRQYYPVSIPPDSQPGGRSGWLASSHDNLLVLDAYIPDVGTLTEADMLVLVPPQLGKYCRYYTLSRAFGRQGEGFNAGMAAFFQSWYGLGVQLLQQLHQLARKDRTVQRHPAGVEDRRPPWVQLPSTYPRVRNW